MDFRSVFSSPWWKRWFYRSGRRPRGAGEGKHYKGRKPRSRAELLKARKRQRQARRYHRMCGQGRKHLYRGMR